FDMRNGGERVPMGSDTASSEIPQFRVGAVGAFKQNPGCPEYAARGLGAERVASLCGGECYNPSDERHLIDRIEIVRIRPQVAPDEPVGDLIEDPWRVFDCAPKQAGCQVKFEDAEFVNAGRETLYYARAIQEPTQMVNANNLRCEYNEQGECIAVNPCYGDFRTPKDEDCLAPAAQRAWSSPIFVAFEPRTADARNEETP
ncbi:MAG: hypothetical protein HKN19_01405, partial [Halioglobus sp.]|nr:hypothetical protein [Halioglobus sp.]